MENSVSSIGLMGETKSIQAEIELDVSCEIGGEKAKSLLPFRRKKFYSSPNQKQIDEKAKTLVCINRRKDFLAHQN